MKLLIIGQTPPPYGGQSINIAEMIRVLEKHQFDFRLIRMNFSDEMSDIGSASTKKLFRLFLILFKLLKSLLLYRPDYVYYPPAGPDKVPMIRDMMLLFPVRLFRFKTIFHYHAGGIASLYNFLSPLMRYFFRFCYYGADCSICLSQLGATDPEQLLSKKTVYIPSGVADHGCPLPGKRMQPTFTVLFAGVCKESKGILDFIAVLKLCRKQNPYITGCVMGKIFAEKEQKAILQAVTEGILRFEGVQTGEEKTHTFRQADVFLFPSFFEAENFPTVILEAFSFGLPVVATTWRGIPDQVIPGQNGFLHPVHDIEGMAASILLLAANTACYAALSANARHDFETRYAMPIFERTIIEEFQALQLPAQV